VRAPWWVWQDSPHVPEVFKCPPDFRQILANSDHWLEDAVKPPKPKAALDYLRRRYRLRVFNAEFGKLAANILVTRCQNPAFSLLCDHLRAWFPEDS
jgi:hypothetical protein